MSFDPDCGILAAAMLLPILCLATLSFAISFAATWIVKRIALRIGFVDKPGHRKIHHTPKALGGGIAIFLGITLPLLAGLVWANLFPGLIHRYELNIASGMRSAAGLLAAMLAMHLLGLWDDRKALGPYFKLVIQIAIIAALVIGLDLRALTFLDHAMGLGKTPSIVLTIIWVAAITNAFNFMDNMDGLSAGVAAVCAIAFLVTALSIGQWFVAAMLALLLGALIGFLCFNFPPAVIFMGDSGSLLIGLLLGILTVRTTYLNPAQQFVSSWYSVFVPVIVLALPLYDMIVVIIIRLSRGKSPFVGDNNHFSHRLVARGMSRRTAVLCLYLITAATSVAAILLPHVESFYAPLIFTQTVLVLAVVALLEQHPLPADNGAGSAPPAYPAPPPQSNQHDPQP